MSIRAWARVSRAAAAATLLVMLVAGCTGPRQSAPPSTPNPPGAPSPTAGDGPPDGPARELRGTALRGPTGLRLLVEGVWYDVDAATSAETEVTSWLRPVTGPPILLVQPPPPPQSQGGTVTVEPAGPGTLRVRSTATRYHLAPSVDGGVWVSEYRSLTSCTLRELAFDGRTRRPARTVACGVEPVLETPHGLWVRRWVNVFTLGGRTVEFTEPTYALLDPRTLRAKASYPEAVVLGAHHVLTMDDHEQNLVLRDLRSGSAVPLAKPADLSFFVFNAEFPLGRISPDGRRAVFRLGSHSVSPQIIDLWTLDLTSGAWQHVPGLPVHGALKYASEAWAPDGRLVMLGQFGTRDPVLATWRPGDARVATGRAPLPEGVYEAGLGLLLVAGPS